MAYQTYTTEAVVCGSRANNTADKAFLLFTRDAGMLWATARNVRSENSKQRFALQDFSLIRVSLIKGKAGWRIGSVEGERNFFREVNGDGALGGRATVVSVIRLLRQFLHGEVSHAEIFDDAKVCLAELLKIVEQEDRDKLFNIFTLRLLTNLGYIATGDEWREYLTSDIWWQLPALSQKADKAIEQAKQASHL